MRGDGPGWTADKVTRSRIHPAEIAVRIPLPDRVQAHVEKEQHPIRGSCLTLAYTRLEEIELIRTLEQGIEAIRRGPR